MHRHDDAWPTSPVRVMLFTRDLRTDDHPALAAASRDGGQVVGLFVLDERMLATRMAAPRRVGLLLEALGSLRMSLEAAGSRLVVRRGDLVEQVAAVVAAVGAQEIHLTQDSSRYARVRISRLKTVGGTIGRSVKVVEHPGVALVAPGEVTPADSDYFKVFTPYLRRWSRHETRTPATVPALAIDPRLVATLVTNEGVIPDLGDVVRDRHPGSVERWKPAVTEGDALARLDQWIDARLDGYGDHDELDRDASTGLSVALHFGSISPARIVERILAATSLPSVDAVFADGPRVAPGRQDAAAAFLRQLCWRDFHLQLLAARPELVGEPLRREPRWVEDPDAFGAWRRGRTGFPLVDAGMRQLEAEGWMPNRVRMITASVLTKHLGIDWRLGAWHFMDHLVDGDLANNFCGWQWAAGTGIDTRPNRFFNPFAQSRRHDPDGSYLRRWLPELASLDAPGIHEPWSTGGPSLLAPDYPPPLIDQAEARARFVERTTA